MLSDVFCFFSNARLFLNMGKYAVLEYRYFATILSKYLASGIA